MTTSQVLLGVGLVLALAVGSQVLASRLRIPAIIILLPAGFAAGQHIRGASKILPVTFLVIVVTVAVYGLTSVPVARRLGVTRPARTRPPRPPDGARSSRASPRSCSSPRQARSRHPVRAARTEGGRHDGPARTAACDLTSITFRG